MAEDNAAPTIEIISPINLSAHVASWDPDQSDFGAYVSLSASVDDPDGDPVTVTWRSSIDGALGAGKAILAFLSTAGSDSAQPIIAATATDSNGTTATATVQIIVWIPSDS